MVLRACRHYGQSREHWWATLTWPLYCDMQQELAEHPPADDLMLAYFVANKWWSPVAPSANGVRDDGDDGEWECPFPDVTE